MSVSSEKITINEASIEEIIKLIESIPEFTFDYQKDFIETDYLDKEKLLIIASFDQKPAGFLIAFNRDNDGSIYWYMAGVNPKFRGQGILKKLVHYFETWAKEHGYAKIKLKTRNKRRPLLTYLVKYGFNFTGVEERKNIEQNRIFAEKDIE